MVALCPVMFASRLYFGQSWVKAQISMLAKKDLIFTFDTLKNLIK